MNRADTTVGEMMTALASAGTLYFASTAEGDLGPLRLRLDRFDLADRDAEDADIVAGIDAIAVLEIRGEPRLADGTGLHGDQQATDQQRHQRRRQRDRGHPWLRSWRHLS